MHAATDYEQQSLTAWAYQELKDMVVGFRHQLEPLLPTTDQPPTAFDLDVAKFIADGHTEQTRIQHLIDQLSIPEQEPEAPQPFPDQTMVAQVDTIVIPSVYVTMVDAGYVPEVGLLTEEGFLLDIDTSKGLDLPDLTIDPRDGGDYSTEVAYVQPVLDTVQFVQDQVPSPIQSTANTIYDKITGSESQ